MNPDSRWWAATLPNVFWLSALAVEDEIGAEGAEPEDLIPASRAAALFNEDIPTISKWHKSGKVFGRPPTPEENLGKVRLLVSKSDVERQVRAKRARKG